MRLIVSWILTFCLSSLWLSGQTLSVEIIDEMVQAAEEGQQRALRDLGTLLDHPEFGQQIKAELQQLLFVTPEEFQFSTIDKSGFLAFYYQKEALIEYSELLRAYYITPLDKHPIEYQSRENAQVDEEQQLLRLRKQQSLFHEALSSGDHTTLLKLIASIRQAPQGEGYRFLLAQLNNHQLVKAKQNQAIFASICQALGAYPAQESFQAILGLLAENQVSADLGAAALAQLSNVGLVSYEDQQDVIRFYQSLYDSLSTISDIRHYGYLEAFPFRPEFFTHPVDYYGKVLNQSEDYPWLLHNATEDLINTGHPRALFYLATQLYKYRETGGKNPTAPDLSFEHILKKLARLDIGLKGSDKLTVYDVEGSDDVPLLKAFIVYWTSHHLDYEWDEHHRYFANKYKAEELSQNYERLFRRLNSQNDSVAQQSFVQLTLGDPVKIAELSDKYRNLLRSYNPSLPPLKYYYLEQLSQLTEFCREQHISYEPNPTFAKKIERLRSSISDQERYTLENEVIRTMGLHEVTALEYQACLYESNVPFSYSVGRILDWFYSHHWATLLANDQSLLLYLKKSQLFSGLGVYGSCNSYLNKFNLHDPTLYSRLEKIAGLTIDDGILSQMSQLVPINEGKVAGPGLETFLEDPMSYHRNDIKILPEPTLEQVISTFEKIKNELDQEIVRQYLYYLRLHRNMDQVPYLFELMKEERPIAKREGRPIPLGEFIVPFVEDIFQYQYPLETARQSWLSKWQKDGKHYRDWTKSFLTERINQLSTEKVITVKVLNDIISAPYFTDEHISDVLTLLPKLRPFRDIRKLQFENNLSLDKHLSYFNPFSLSYKELDNLPSLFYITPETTPVMLNYLKAKSERFTGSKKGAFYNSLFRSEWFTIYLNSLEQPNEHTEHILGVLREYLEESDFLSEYQEQITYRHMASLEYLGLSLYERLAASIQLQIDEGSKAKIQEAILAKLQYEDLGKIAPLIENLSVVPGKNPYAFLQKDFGLPIFHLDEPGALQEFTDRHKKLDQADFYAYYLEAFGLDFRDKKRNLDFNKIYDILHFDLVTPFVSRTGGQRDHYIYGLIKLLELHFDTRLGFHEKLNENQTFYTFTSAKRANAWMNYLSEHHLVDKDHYLPPSFSQLRKEQ